MNRVFLDTGYLIALEASDDQHHEKAIRHWRESVPEISSIVTTTYVFDEVVTFFNSRGITANQSRLVSDCSGVLGSKQFT